jgi:hypothetical protein
MLPLTQNPEWRRLWDERGRAVGRVLGETVPPGEVTPFSWKQFILPGACGLTFGPSAKRPHYTYMTLGLTQPVKLGDAALEWEFALKANEHAMWPQQVLFDLLTYWLDQKPRIRRGLFLPLTFFLNAGEQLCAGLTSRTDRLRVVGAVRGLYLWDDLEHLRFEVSSGEFGLMVAVAVTEDEIQLARSTTPPHLLLLLKRMQIGQVSDPLRESVLTLPGAEAEWERVRTMSHDQAVIELGGSTGPPHLNFEK